jgi:hypothetical protein
MPRQIPAKTNIAARLATIGTSAVPKKDHRNPETRYNTGFSNDTFCQNGGSMLTE